MILPHYSLSLWLWLFLVMWIFFFFSSRRRHTRFSRDWSSDVCSSDLVKTRQPGKENAKVSDTISIAAKYDPKKFAVGKVIAIGRSRFKIEKTQTSNESVRSEERRVGKEWREGWTPSEQRKSRYKERRV